MIGACRLSNSFVLWDYPTGVTLSLLSPSSSPPFSSLANLTLTLALFLSLSRSLAPSLPHRCDFKRSFDGYVDVFLLEPLRDGECGREIRSEHLESDCPFDGLEEGCHGESSKEFAEYNR